MSSNALYKQQAYFVPPVVAKQYMRRDGSTAEPGFSALSEYVYLLVDIGAKLGMPITPEMAHSYLLGQSYNSTDVDGYNAVATLNSQLLPLVNVARATRSLLGL